MNPVPDWTIRPAEPRDIDAWIAMRQQLGPEWVDPGFGVHARAFFGTGTIDHLPHGVLIAEAQRRPIGVAEVSLRPFAEGCESTPVGYLEGWFVAEVWRGRGVGRALLSAGEAWAAQQGCSEFASDAELHNTGSLRAHGSVGFEPVCDIRCFRKRIENGSDSRIS